ncbi:biopolymer transport protein ExbD [Terrimicrobium sacchariphilum]|jgi:biopolymer transport protein ExbD|uniref:Biopolymer transport protein ExbD n=1 Tax=Terrimicrobium sacchariphilum TaxID=690879 RepID=A0A146G808_TERSA|nr:biopolymer transporter ExbD [Terrimicrobium sacchariphilum]GAT33017.1 biopolymer transport protein ExbD [Terrimicrobium sacchariphilum]
MAGGGNLESGEPEFQIAPMVDVLLVILIFFMTITSAQVLKVDRNIKLPIAQNATKKENMRREAIVNVQWNAEKHSAGFTFDDQSYEDASRMLEPLRSAKARSDQTRDTATSPEEYRAVIRADRDVPVRYVAAAMGACAQAGISDISFSATNRD